MSRTIVHADLDAFYASVEQLDNPELRGKPVVVGGSPEGRGVVMAASYEARRFGVRSAMPMSRALRLCPRAVRLPARFDRYSELSRDVMTIFREVTPLVAPLSLDEAFLDATDHMDRFDGPESLGRHLKGEVRKRTGLVLSVGIAANKLVAKIASDTGKPDGLVVVPPGTEAAFLAPLKVRALWGVGPKTEAVLHAAGFHIIGQLAAAEPAHLETSLGSRGLWLHDMARGLDDSPVHTEHERKSVGAENTFPRDLSRRPRTPRRARPHRRKRRPPPGEERLPRAHGRPQAPLRQLPHDHAPIEPPPADRGRARDRRRRPRPPRRRRQPRRPLPPHRHPRHEPREG